VVLALVEEPSLAIRDFFFPRVTPRFLIRASAVGLSAYLFFGHVFTPFLIKGQSMEPTHRDRSFNFCWRLKYLLTEPARHDVVTVRFAGSSVMLLKRIVALEGEKIEFRNGRLLVDDQEIEEPYVRNPCNWNLPPRIVERGCVYLVGDNRTMPIENHFLGQASLKRIIGAPLW